jgi:UDP-N-acetylglucosamine 2-epimerase (non-hydrolysing)
LITGNTVIDALQHVLAHLSPEREYAVPRGRRRVLVTCHRRENFEKGIAAVCQAIRTLVGSAPDLDFLVVMHPNPKVRLQMDRELSDGPSLKKIDPMAYCDFVHALRSAWIVLTDSGGVQEEATALGIPFLVLRDETERPEGLRSGTGVLVGTDTTRVVAEVERLGQIESAYRAMATPSTVFGDGRAALRIADSLRASL